MSPIPSSSRIARPAVELMIPFDAEARLGEAEVERVVGARGQEPVDVDEVADLGDLRADDDPVVARARSPRRARRIASPTRSSPRSSRRGRRAAPRIAALTSISSVRSAWSSEPQLTPIRTGLSLSIATWTIVAKCSSWRFAPTLPGLIRYLARIRGRLRVLHEQLVAVVVEVADDRDVRRRDPRACGRSRGRPRRPPRC